MVDNADSSSYLSENIKLKNEILVCFRRQDTKKNIKYSFLNEKNVVQNLSKNLISCIVVARQYEFIVVFWHNL